MTNPQDAIKQVVDALSYSSNHRYGDGDVTYMFEKALQAAKDLQAHLNELPPLDSDLEQTVEMLTEHNHILREALEHYEFVDNEAVKFIQGFSAKADAIDQNSIAGKALRLTDTNKPKEGE